MPFNASLLDWQTAPNGTDKQATIYVEAIRASTALANQTIALSVDPNGNDFFTPVDSVCLTVVQDIAPDYYVAGTILGVAQGADGGDPMANAYSGPVRLSDGTVHLANTDLSVSGYGVAWGITRVWTNEFIPGINPSFGNGTSIVQLPQLIQATGSIIAVIGSQEFFFDEVSPNTYKERFFGLETLSYDASNHQYVLADTTGTRIAFNDFTIQDPDDPILGMYKRGGFKGLTDADGNQVTVPASGYDVLGNITEMDHGGNVFTLQYTPTGTSSERLEKVTITHSGTTIADATYAYYGANDPQNNGNDGDLKSVNVRQDAGNGGGLTSVAGSYYRYWTASCWYQGLEYAVVGAGFARMSAECSDPDSCDVRRVRRLLLRLRRTEVAGACGFGTHPRHRELRFPVARRIGLVAVRV